MSKRSVLQEMMDRAGIELSRVASIRPALGSRCERAAGILAEQAASPRSSVIRAQVRGGELVGYLVRGTGGAVYRVEAKGTWRCSCPDHHSRHRRPSAGSRACKHGLACWALWRAAMGAPAPTAVAVEVERCSVDYHATRDELATMVNGTVHELPAAYHLRTHQDAGDSACWGRREGCVGLEAPTDHRKALR